MNGDGRADVICTGGWWEQPADAKTTDKAWKFHPADLGPDCSDMFAYDMDGDGKADILSARPTTTASGRTFRKPGKDGDPSFLKVGPFPPSLLSDARHALRGYQRRRLERFGDGQALVAHGSHGDADPNLPAVIYWFEAKKQDGVTTFTPHVIDNDSGVGTQFAVADVNGDGLLDIVVSNKKGTCIIEQVRAKK